MLWLGTRISLSLCALVASVTNPVTQLEQQLPPWPPSRPLDRWLDRVLLEPWNRWDVEHYLKIATQGFRADDGTASFHPLFPLLGKAVGALLGGRELWGLFLVSNLSCLLFLLALERLARLDLSRDQAHRACVFFLLLPGAFALFVPYTEALFLVCSVTALLMARYGRWWLAGLMGGLATLTRQQGILLVLPLAWELWEASERNWRKLPARWADACGLLLTPLALGGWLAYRNLALSDTPFDWRQPNTWVYGLFISRSANQIVTEQEFATPWKAIGLAITHPSSTNIIDLTFGAVYMLLLITGARVLWRLRRSYCVYTLATILVAFSYSTGLPYSYMGLLRHCLLAFPLAIFLAMLSPTTILAASTKAIGLISLLLLTVLYVWKILWVP